LPSLNGAACPTHEVAKDLAGGFLRFDFIRFPPAPEGAEKARTEKFF